MPKLQPIIDVPIPGKPLQPSLLNEEIFERLYMLRYIKYNVPDAKLILIPEPLEMYEVINKCKEYCDSKGYRFLWVEKAITILE